jgi:hypothetical protein
MTAHEAILMAVPRLQVAGRKQGNLGRPLFFEIGEQRDERQLIKMKQQTSSTRCRLKETSYGDLLSERTVGGATHHS